MNATGAEQMLTLGGARGVVRDNGARDGHMQQGVRKAGGAMSLGGVIQDAEVRSGGRNRGAVIDQGVDHFTRASERILRGQLLRNILLQDAS